jgi:hypothetical protein
MPYREATVRPVALRKSDKAAAPAVQVSTLTARQDLTRNHRPGEDARQVVRELLDLPWRSVSLMRTDGSGVRVTFSRKGRELVTRQKRAAAEVTAGAEDEGTTSVATPKAPLLLSHDRRKPLPLPPDEPDPFLQRLGLQSADGRCKADSRRKLAQVNALLRLMDATGAIGVGQKSKEQGLLLGKEEVHVLDAGCGASVLTFGVYRHLQKKAASAAAAAGGGGASSPPTRVRLTGVDTNADLMRRSAEHARALLDPRDPPAAFLAMPIRDYGGGGGGGGGEGAPPDVVLALHACDGATDEALALAVRTRARLILAVPCCMATMHREYAGRVKAGAGLGSGAGSGEEDDDEQEQGGGDDLLRAAVLRASSARGTTKSRRSGARDSSTQPPLPPPPSEAPLAALLRHATLRNRLLDLATDAMRAALLRCLGYTADAVEFVPTEHTPRNLLLRAVLPRRAWRDGNGGGGGSGPLPLDRAVVREYRRMRAFFGGVAPPLEAMLERDGQLPEGWLDYGGGGDD